MKNWKEYPHLFANGKFELRYSDNTGTIDSHFNPNVFSHYECWIREEKTYGKVQLIARPKSDLKDNEKDKCDEEYYKDPVLGFLYLLSIGVYPFNQDHFNNPELIDKTTMGPHLEQVDKERIKTLKNKKRQGVLREWERNEYL